MDWRLYGSPLHLAVMHQNRDLIDLLLANGADINQTDEGYNMTPLHYAVDFGKWTPNYELFDMMSFLIARGAQKDLFVEIWLENFDGVEHYLREHPEQVNQIGPFYAPPLHHVYNPNLAKILLEHGADMHAHIERIVWDDKELNTPIRCAVGEVGKLDVFKVMLAHGEIEKDIFLACALGDRAWVATALASEPELVHARTNASHILSADMTPLHIALRYPRPPIDTTDLIRLLLDHDADIEAQTRSYHGKTPLLLAATNEQNLRLLLNRGADVQARDQEEKWSAIQWARFDWDQGNRTFELDAIVELLQSYGIEGES